MNVSQHSFVPTGKFYLNKYYNASGNWVDVNQQSSGKVASSIFQSLPYDVTCNAIAAYCRPAAVGATQSVGKVIVDSELVNLVNQFYVSDNIISCSSFTSFQSVSAIPGLYQVVFLCFKV